MLQKSRKSQAKGPTVSSSSGLFKINTKKNGKSAKLHDEEEEEITLKSKGNQKLEIIDMRNNNEGEVLNDFNALSTKS